MPLKAFIGMLNPMPPHPESAPAGHTIDHVAHFLPDLDAASTALTRLGFTLTPLSAQSHRVTPGGPLTPAGTSNRCVMLACGYLEFLTPMHETHDTPNAQQLRDAMARYTGVHLIAFGTDAPDADHARLAREDFAPLPAVALQRQVDTEDGDATARFTVVRVPPDAMAEGRIQYCHHHTPGVVWQPRWIDHPNHATGLAGVLICVDDPAAAAQRYARFTGLAARPAGKAWRIDTARGYLLFYSPDVSQQWLNITPPVLPWIAGYVIDSRDMAATRAITRHIADGQKLADRLCVTLPDTLGGMMIFQTAGSPPLNPLE